ncbi:hypothetical protein [Tahibacter sp.]|uniref:hypothetical protein n=1 Tax=Tahibacter sp. TaxID=2056211 RepID=UPI0028C3E73B|nr:hypothetical protein [Tahibacter sp.]
MSVHRQTPLRSIQLLGPALLNAASSTTAPAPSLWRLVVDGNYAGPGARPAESRNVGVRVLLQDALPRPLHPENSWAAPPHDATPVDFHVPRLLQLRVRQRGGPRLGIAASADLAIQPDLTASELIAVPDYRDPLAGDWPRAAARNAAGKAEIVLPALRLANGRIRVTLAKDIRDVSLGLNETIYRLFADAYAEGLRVLANNGLFVLDLVADGIEFDAELPNPLSTGPATLPRARVRLFHGRHPLSGEPRYGLALIGAPEEELGNLRDALAQIDRESERISAATGDPNRAPLRLRPNPYQRVVPLCWWLDPDLRFRQDRDTVTATIGGELLRPLLQTRVATSSLPLPAEFHALSVSVARTGSQRTLQLDTHVDDDAGRRELEALKLTWRTAPETAVPAFAATLQRADGAPFPLSLDLALERERLTALYANAGALPAGRPAPYAFIPVSRGLLQLPLSPESTDEVPPSPAVRRLARDAFSGLIAAEITTVANEASVPAQAIEASGAAALVARLSLDGAHLLTTEVDLRGPRARLSGLFWCIEASPRPEEILPVLDGGPAALRTLDLHVGRDSERGPGFAAQHWSSAAAWTLQLSAGSDATAYAWLRHTTLPLIAAASMTRTAAAAAQPSRSRHMVPTALTYGPAKAPIRLTYQPGQLRPQLAGGAGTATAWPWPNRGVNNAAAMSTQPPSVALLPLHVPGVVAVPDDPKNWTSTTALHAALRFDLPLLDELHASSVLPRTEPLAAAFGPVVAPVPVATGTTALDLTTLAERWRDTAERLSLAATQIAHATGWTPPITAAAAHSADAGTLVSVTGLVEPFTFETRFGLLGHDVLQGTRLPFGSYVFAGEHAAGERALRGWKAELVIRDDELQPADPATADSATAEQIHIVGFAAQARQDPLSGEVTDSRGTTLAAQARTLEGIAGALVLRAQRRHYRDANGAVDTIAEELATLQQPLPLRFGADGTTAAQLWFRDLPLRELAFDASHSVLETVAGPGDSALQGSNIAANAYEWRCFGNDEQFDIALGALRFRPLRLAAVVLGRDGDEWRPLSARLIGRLQLPLTPAVDAPFGRDHEYLSGNLVALELSSDGDGLRLTQVQRLQLTTAADATLPWQVSTEPLRFQLGAGLVYVNGSSVSATDTRLPVELELSLAPALMNGAPAFDAATLRLRLFGSDLALSGSATPAAPASDIAGLAFAPPPTAAAAGAQIALHTITLQPRDTDWTLHLDATLQLDLPGHRGTLLPLLRWPLAQPPQWIGLNFAAAESTDENAFVTQIDHADGTLTATSTGLLPIEGDWLGVLPLTGARAGGAFAFVFDGSPALRAASAFVELLLRSDLLEMRQQIVSPPRAGDVWRSTLTIDAAIERTSRIGWPVDGVVIGAAGNPGLAVAVDIHAAEPLRHRTRLTLRGHALPLEALGLRDDRLRLVAPWRLRALVEHWLLREANARHWSSLDEVALVDLSLPEAAPPSYEFLARYRMELVDGVERPAPFMRHPGLAATAFAHAGLTYAAAQSVGLSGLVAVGAGVTVFEVEPSAGARHERVLTMPWITALADDAADAPLSFAQAGAATRRWLIADNDLPPMPIPMAGSDRAWALAVGDASQARLSLALDDAFVSAGAAVPAARALMPREQSLLQVEDGQPVEAAAEPRWPRTLLTLKALLNERPPRRTLALVPSGRSDGRALRLLISVPRSSSAPPAAAELPPADLIVLGRTGLARVDLDGDAATRADDLSGLRQRAWQALATPRVALFATRDLATPASPRDAGSVSVALPARATSWTTYWHEAAWSAIGALPPYRGPVTASPLRYRNDTLHASAALGWPTARNVADLAASSLVRGGDSVLQSPRGFALRLGDRRLPGAAPARDSTADARFLSLSHHVLFERPPLTLIAPPASHLVPLSPRARMPLASELAAALPTAAECAPLLPGAVQHGVIGARAGAMYLSREALLLPLRNDANETAAFDAQHARFGRPAGYAPAVLHQGRAPRSPGLPRDRLYGGDGAIVAAREARRRTFVAWSLRTGAPEHGEIATCLIAEGGAALLRDKAQNAAWLLRVAAAPGGTITPANATKLVLSVRALTPVDAAVDDPCQTLKQRGRVSLVIDGWTLPLELSAGVDDGSGGKLFRCSVATAQQESVIQRLRAASADARIELQVRIAPDANPENPQSLLRHADIARLPLPLRPDDRPTPPLQFVSLLFADPAYDRELTSAARQESVVIGQKLLRLSLDRTGYAAGDTVYIAFGLIDNASGTFSSDALPGSQISVHILRDGKIEPVTLTAAKPAISPDGARFEAIANTPYCIRLDDVLLVRGEPDKPSFEPAQLRAGDQLIVRLYGPQGLLLSAQVPIVAEPTLAPPAAVYGLITRHADDAYATVPLFATAPLPSVVELPHLLEDLATGAVRRCGLFSWTFVAETPLLPGTACAALVKLDRAGGGQFPEILDTDFVGLQPPVAPA